ncbi:MAG: hypothetical protein ACYTAO_16505, partial [Planctomycetota bacterium]
MTVKEFWAQIGRWLRVHNPLAQAAPQPEIGEDGLINLDPEPDAARVEGVPPSNRGQDARDTNVVVRATPPADRQESLEKLQQGFDKLVEQLEGINEHLNRQASQHDD